MELNNIKEKELIISLIRDSLISYKLVAGLNALGLQANDYASYLGGTVFLLMDFNNQEQSDLLFETIFLANAEKVRNIDFSDSTKQLDALSEEIYNELLFAKDICNTGS